MGYSGEIYEIRDTRLEISFEQIPVLQSFFIHLIIVQPKSDPLVTTISTTIPFDQQTSLVFSRPASEILFEHLSKTSRSTLFVR